MSSVAEPEPLDVAHALDTSPTRENRHESTRDVMHSISHIPPELLADIFLQVALPFCKWYEASANNQPQAPGYYLRLYSLSRVCKLWFQVVNSTPMLWAILSIHYKPELIRLVMQRSSKHLMEVDYSQEGRGITREREPLDHQTFVPTLAEVASRLQRAMIRFPSQHLAGLYLPAFRQPAPHLTELRIECRMSEDFTQEHVILFQDQLPNLQVLDLMGLPVRWTAPYLFNLRHLSLGDILEDSSPTNMELCTILGGCRSLETLCLNHIDVRVDPEAPTHPIPLEQLRSLQLRNLPLEATIYFLRIIPLDKLHQFDFDFNIPRLSPEEILSEVIGYCTRVLHLGGNAVDDTSMELVIWYGHSEFTFRRARRRCRLRLGNVIEPFVDVLKGFIASRPLGLHLADVNWATPRYEWLLEGLNPIRLGLSHHTRRPDYYTPLFRILAEPKVSASDMMLWELQNLESLTYRARVVNWDEVVGMLEGRYREPSVELAGTYSAVQRPRILRFGYLSALNPSEQVMETIGAILGTRNVRPVTGFGFSG